MNKVYFLFRVQAELFPEFRKQVRECNPLPQTFRIIAGDFGNFLCDCPRQIRFFQQSLFFRHFFLPLHAQFAPPPPAFPHEDKV